MIKTFKIRGLRKQNQAKKIREIIVLNCCEYELNGRGRNVAIVFFYRKSDNNLDLTFNT